MPSRIAAQANNPRCQLLQATADTVHLGPPHPPKEESITAFTHLLLELKRSLVHLRHDHQKHEAEYFAAVDHLNDHQLAGFGPAELVSVRVASSAYGVHLFGKVRIPAMPESGPAYIHFRAFIAGGEEPPKLHSIHTEEKVEAGGGRTYRAVFTRDDGLEWFDN
ncbi:Uncharacterized protein TPAR_04432 [Tolypocladium paradoxum]|uniref:Uncharacterized protein n=1 Tax=Tolypocladium paradoxum TaxID=94208 RepID=A0A2S4KYW2_9HYPO|nr:Uncharacterized protein TPAR_04432 [Tolypocladium paradoxum]